MFTIPDHTANDYQRMSVHDAQNFNKSLMESGAITYSFIVKYLPVH